MKQLTGREEPLCISCKKEIQWINWVCYQYCGACMPAERKERDGKLAKAKRTVRSNGTRKGGRKTARQRLIESLGDEAVVMDWGEFASIDDEVGPCEVVAID